MDRRAATAILFAITILAMFTALQPILPARNQPSSELAVLGSNLTFGEYPTSVVVGQPFLLYAYIGNHAGIASYYKLLVKLGNQTTLVSNSTSAQAPVIFTYPRVLDNNQSTTFPMMLTIDQEANNTRLIFELWSYNATNSQFVYTGVWNQLLLNVTSSLS
jgi:uncharacterized membrane protein